MIALLQSLRITLIASIAAFLLAACESDGGGQIAGIEGTGVTSGFGSVFINGIEFETDDAQIFFNGESVGEQALRVGDIVRFSGTVDGNGRARAERIEFNRTVDGPIQQLSLHNGTGVLSTLEQTVQFDENTSFINTSPEQLALDDLIAVSGQRGPDGVIRATSIEENSMPYTAGVTRIDAQGHVRNLDRGAQTFNIGDLAVEFASADVDEQVGALEEGAFVDAFGLQSGDGAPLRADTVRVRERMLGESGERVSIDDVITDFSGLADFRLDGQPVDASDARRLDNAAINPANGVRVLVEGPLRAGVVEADSISLRPPSDIGFAAVVDSVSAAGFNLLGLDANVAPTTLYLDKSDSNRRDFRIGSLQPGDRVIARGFRNTDGDLMITRLERTVAAPQSRARGPLTQIDADNRNLTVDRVTVRTDSSTEFVDARGATLDESAFYASLAAGDRVEATGPENASEINVAQRVQRLSN